MCVCDLCALAGASVGLSGKGKGSVSGGSGLAAGCNGDTLNSHLTHMAGDGQYTCI